MTPVSANSTTPFVTDSNKASSHASIDLTFDGNFDSVTAVEVSRKSKPHIDFKENGSDLSDNSASSCDRFTGITERKEEELKPARYERFATM